MSAPPPQALVWSSFLLQTSVETSHSLSPCRSGRDVGEVFCRLTNGGVAQVWADIRKHRPWRPPPGHSELFAS